jgi:hypothetical protein
MTDEFDYEPYIARALATSGGHLSIGYGGFTLHYDHCRLSGHDGDTIKAEAIAAGLPVIDSRELPFDIAALLAVSGPMIAVNQPPSERPWHGFAYAPLAVVGTAYRHAGADVHNIPDEPDVTDWFKQHPPGPSADILRFWLVHVRREEVQHA